jgi:hypothetical protein
MPSGGHRLAAVIVSRIRFWWALLTCGASQEHALAARPERVPKLLVCSELSSMNVIGF